MTRKPIDCLFLFDRSHVIATPWLQNGYTCLSIDLLGGESNDRPELSGTQYHERLDLSVAPDLGAMGYDLSECKFAFAFPPCDHLSVSWARWFKGKGLRALQQSIGFFATAIEMFEKLSCPWGIENPVSTISTYWRTPDYVFQPWQYAGLAPEDNYAKTTCLWTGGEFVMPYPSLGSEPINNTKIHHSPDSSMRKQRRSMTPLGFSIAVYNSNKPR